MSASRVEIEHALDLIASDEGGMRFQGLAVVLARLRWPQLIACERKRDLGLDAHAPASTSANGKGMGLSCSITAELSKITSDADRAKDHFPDLNILIFATSQKVTNTTSEPWKTHMQEKYGWELIVMSREDIITTLQLPQNAGICKQHLGITVAPVEPTLEELIEKTLAASDKVRANWSRRLAGKPIVDLRLVLLDDQGAETEAMQRRSGLSDLLARGQRIEIEAPAGRGKTTTLAELADEHRREGRIACLIDLPAWVRRQTELLDFLAGMQEFRSQGITANDLARVHEVSPLTFLLNGWNELAVSESVRAAEAVRGLDRSYPASGIAVATRTHPVTIPLPAASRYRIQPLTRQERAGYLHARLGTDADQLIATLRTDAVLDELTRTPLILAEVASLYEAGKPIPNSKLGVLDAVTRLMEASETHQAALSDTPLSGFARSFLQIIAKELVASGGVQIQDAKARAIVSRVSRTLQEAGQIETLPDPGEVLTALSSHHVMERAAYPDVTYTFFHQQFQELFAALQLKEELSILGAGAEDRLGFVTAYVNQPAWTQPLEMLADFIGKTHDATQSMIAEGVALVEMALPVDAVFAAGLGRLCGTAVWKRVSDIVGKRLRELYARPQRLHREIGLAGMVASGSEDFNDVLLPLLTSESPNSRMEVFRTGERFHVSSIGANWRDSVAQWSEEARASFVSEMLHYGQTNSEIGNFALADPSAAVQKAFLSHVWWEMPSEELTRLSTTLSEVHFRDLVVGMPTEYIPPQLRTRAAEMYSTLAKSDTKPTGRFSSWRRAYALGHGDALQNLKQALSEMDTTEVRSLDPRRLRSTLDSLRVDDPAWVSEWTTQQILAGALSPDDWISMVVGLSVPLRDELLNRIKTENVTEMRIPGVIPLLRHFADASVVKVLFGSLCEMIPVIAQSKPGDEKKAEAGLGRQAENLLRQMPAPLVIESILEAVNGETDAVAVKAIANIFHGVGRSDSSLRTELPNQLRERFRDYLKSCIDTVLTLEDKSGQTKAYFATVLAQVGDASDLPQMERLIEADLARYRAELSSRIAARPRPPRRKAP